MTRVPRITDPRSVPVVGIDDHLAPIEKVHTLRQGLAEHYQRSDYLRCESMGALIRENIESIRRDIGRAIVPELVPK